LIFRLDQREDPLERSVTDNEVLIEIIRVDGRLSSVEAEVLNLLVFLADFLCDLSVELGASLRVLAGRSTVV